VLRRFACTVAALGVAALLGGCAGGPPARADEDVPELVGVWYTVERGDTLGGIARAHDVPLEDLAEINGLVDPDRLEVGQVLFLYGVDEAVRRLPPGEPTAPGEAAPRFRWPVEVGTLSSGFGPRGGRPHKGVDLAAPPGTPIFAAAAGKVVYSDDKQRGYGNLVILRHAGGYVTVYAHNRRNLVDVGDQVRQGSRIAEVGSTGRSTGPHLHFEIRVDGKAIDPLIHLPAR
jgi:murein DD-endopeptidase MepM/ murein hydrolase activator NlpD